MKSLTQSIVAIIFSALAFFVPMTAFAQSVPASITCPANVVYGSPVILTISGGSAASDYVTIREADPNSVRGDLVSPYHHLARLPRPAALYIQSEYLGLGSYKASFFKSDNTLLGSCAFTISALTSTTPVLTVPESSYPFTLQGMNKLNARFFVNWKNLMPVTPDTSGSGVNSSTKIWLYSKAGVKIPSKATTIVAYPNVVGQISSPAGIISNQQPSVPYSQIGTTEVFAGEDLAPGEYFLRAETASGVKIVDSNVFSLVSGSVNSGLSISPVEKSVTVQKAVGTAEVVGGEISANYTNVPAGSTISVVYNSPIANYADPMRSTNFISSALISEGGSGKVTLQIYSSNYYATAEPYLKSGEFYFRVKTPDGKTTESQPITITILEPVPTTNIKVSPQTSSVISCVVPTDRPSQIVATVTGTKKNDDFIAVYPKGAGDIEYYSSGALPSFQYVGVPLPQKLTFTAPTKPGLYDIRVLVNNSYFSNGQYIYNPNSFGSCSFEVGASQSSTVAPPTTPVTPTATTGTQTGGGYCPTLSSDFEQNATDATTNGQVRELQKFLAAYFSVDQSTLVVGSYGPTTQTYTTRFQTEKGLPATGYIGERTRAAIAAACGGVTQKPATPVTETNTPTVTPTTQTTTTTNPTTTVTTPTTPPPTCAITLSTQTISGGPLTVTWSSTNATSRSYISARNGVQNYGPASVSTSGTQTVAYEGLGGPGTITRTDTVVGPGGSAQCSATLQVTAPGTTPVPTPTPAPTCALTYSPSSLASGSSMAVAWNSTNATSRSYGVYRSDGSAIVTGQNATVSGTINVASMTDLPVGTYTRRDTVTGAGGTAQCSATLQITAPGTTIAPRPVIETNTPPTTPAPTCTISHSPSTISGGQLAVTWTSSNATSRSYVSAKNGVQNYGPAAVSTSGTMTAAYENLGGPGVYTRTDTVVGPGGTARCSDVVTVVAPSVPTPTPTTPAPTCTISHSPSTISGGQLGVVWTSSNATSRSYVSAKNGVQNYGPATVSTSGTMSVAYEGLGGPGVYTRTDTVTGPGGTGQCSNIVTVVAPGTTTVTPTVTTTPTPTTPAPTCTISHSPSTISGGQLGVVWTSTISAPFKATRRRDRSSARASSGPTR